MEVTTMSNTATAVDKETAATEECTLSDEFIEMVLAAEEEMRNRPDKWIDYKDAIRELREI